MSQFVAAPFEYVTFELVLAALQMLTVLIVSFFGFRAYAVSRDMKHFFFGLAFLLLLLAFASKGASSYYFIANALCLGCIGYAEFFAFHYLFVALTIFGVGTLGLIYIKYTNSYAISIFAFIMVIIAFISTQSYWAFLGFIGLIYGFITLRALENLTVKSTHSRLLTVFGFGLLALAQFFHAATIYHSLFLPASQILSLGGYGLLAYVLFRVFAG